MVEKVCAALNDDELCEIVHKAIEEKYGYEQIIEEKGRKPPYPLKIVFYVYGLHGHICVNGFAAFAVLDCKHAFFCQALREIHEPYLAQVVEQSFTMFQAFEPYWEGHPYPFIDGLSLREFVEKHPETDPWFEQLTTEYFAKDETLISSLSVFIRTHRKLLTRLSAELKQQPEFELVKSRS